MQVVIHRMNLHGRGVLCGLISSYTKNDPVLASFGQALIKQLRVEALSSWTMLRVLWKPHRS